MHEKVTNIVFAGLGGQGVLKASDIVADAAFRSGLDVKKAEVHGMSQRGGFVQSDVRFGPRVHSPMVPPGEADYLVVLAADQAETAMGNLKPDGILITPTAIDEKTLPSKRALNVALVGALSKHLDLPESSWVAAIRAAFAERHHEANLQAFSLGRR
jgi:indolepyruvate ferredoxin oxidoreductase, beta subunit